MSHRQLRNHFTHINQQFRAKAVCKLSCKYCGEEVCKRGMKAILLGDISVELFSTDIAPVPAVELVHDEYQTESCQCKIKDVACLGCGNVVGYHVTEPCQMCLSACHNGHFWMFHNNCLFYEERTDPKSMKPMLWGSIPQPADTEIPGNDKVKPVRQAIPCIR